MAAKITYFHSNFTTEVHFIFPEVIAYFCFSFEMVTLFYLFFLFLVCGGIITDTSGMIRAETKTAGGYHNNEKCTWLIRFPAGQRVSIQFSSFRVEYHPSCSFDYVEIRDGDGVSSPIVGRFCGSIVPPPFISTGNTLNVTFVTDFSVNYDGFSMRYSNAGPGKCSFNSHCTSNVAKGQGGVSQPNGSKVDVGETPNLQ